MTRDDQEATPATDRQRVTDLLGRPPAGAFAVVVRRPDGTPVVIENAPFLEDGRPMPTRYWLVDPDLRVAVSRLESEGGVRRAIAELPNEEIEAAHARYAEAREKVIPPGHSGPRPSGGVGGTRRGVKCLHAHLAWHLAGGDDPVGRWTASQIGLERPGLSSGPVAAVDCGTNSTRLLIVGANGIALDRQMHITRLGEGVDSTQQLSREAVDRTFDVLRGYRRRMDRNLVRRLRVAATSAARDATNAEEFLAGVADILGVVPEVLSGEEEGRLSFAGATARLPAGTADNGPVLVADIGGGSTELIVGTPGPGGRFEPPTSRSLDIGCVRISERFLLHDPPLPSELAGARAAVREDLRASLAELPKIWPSSPFLGLAGTVSTLASLKLGISEYDRDRIHHSVLDRDDVERWLAILAGEDGSARLSRPGMVRGREDVIVGGAIVLAEIMETFDRSVCLVSEDDILDGLAATLLVRS